jgi:hypothetical protein
VELGDSFTDVFAGGKKMVKSFLKKYNSGIGTGLKLLRVGPILIMTISKS